MRTRFCVYTALTGNYEKLNEQPAASGSGIDFICFTDDASLKSKTWKIVKIDPTFADDPVRSQRIVKLSPFDYCADYDVSLYIDNSVVLSAKPEHIFERYSASWDFLIPGHSFRKCVLDEFRTVRKLSFADSARLKEQLAHYMAADPEGLKEQPYWGGVQIRRHSNPQVRQALRVWLAHVLRFTRRDQLSANFAFRQIGFSPHRLDIDNYASWFHAWPICYERNEAARRFKTSWIDRLKSRVSFEANLLLQRIEVKEHFANQRASSPVDGGRRIHR